jgi:hypothetical protein
MGSLLEVAPPPAPPGAEVPLEPALRADGISLFAAPNHALVLRKAAGTLGAKVAASPQGWIAAHLALADQGDFVALIGEAALAPQGRALQAAARDGTRLAVSHGRDLRSAGRLEEAAGGNFLLLGGVDVREDFAALLARGRRVLCIEGAAYDVLQAAVKMISG